MNLFNSSRMNDQLKSKYNEFWEAIQNDKFLDSDGNKANAKATKLDEIPRWTQEA